MTERYEGSPRLRGTTDTLREHTRSLLLRYSPGELIAGGKGRVDFDEMHRGVVISSHTWKVSSIGIQHTSDRTTTYAVRFTCLDLPSLKYKEVYVEIPNDKKPF